jgi:hypothetical protein
MPGIFNRKYHLYTIIQIALHQIGRAKVYFLFSIVMECGFKSEVQLCRLLRGKLE